MEIDNFNETLKNKFEQQSKEKIKEISLLASNILKNESMKPDQALLSALMIVVANLSVEIDWIKGRFEK